MIDERYCKRSGCESDPETCGYGPSQCVDNTLSRMSDTLVQINVDANEAMKLSDPVLKTQQMNVILRKCNEIRDTQSLIQELLND